MSTLIPGATVALAGWRQAVEANREQAERFREGSAGQDFYAPIASAFQADPLRSDEPALEAVRSLIVPGETWLDIGAGGGRYSLPIALRAGRVIAVEPSEGMRSVLSAGMAEHGISNIEIVESAWPMASAPQADVAFISHVGYDIAEIGPFLDAMEASARRLCVALLLQQAPASLAAPFWPPIHGEPRSLLPGLPEFLAILLARGKFFEVQGVGVRPPAIYRDPEGALTYLRMQLFVREGGEKDRLLAREVESRHTAAGTLAGTEPVRLGLVTWEP